MAASDGGHTLTEVMVVLGLLGIAAAASGPGLARLLRDTRTSAAVNDLLHTVAAARVAAASVAQRAVVCGSADGRQCSGSMDWSRGVISFVDADGRDPPTVDAGDRILSAHGAYAQQEVTSNRAAIVFEPDARFATPATIMSGGHGHRERMPMMSCAPAFLRELSREPPKSGPWKSSMSWSRPAAARMQAPWDTLDSPAIWIPASPSAP